MLYYSNFDLENVITPVNAKMFEKLLIQSSYSKRKTKYLIQGFSCGFNLHYERKKDVKIFSNNLRLQVGSKTILWSKVMKEVREN